VARQRNTRGHSRNHFCCVQEINITYSECVSVALVIHHAMRMRRIILSFVACLVLPHYIFCVCVCSLSHPPCNAHTPYYIVICGLSCSTILHILCVCVCSLRYPPRNAHAPYYIAICGLSVSTILHILCVYVCILRYPPCNAHAPYYIVICGLSGSAILHILCVCL
jgi:hypothetical protein